MERKFELTCTHTVWSIVGCPFSLCRRPTFSSPHPNFGKVALWKLHTTRQKTQNCSWASSTLFSPGKSSALKRKIKPDCYETGYTCWHILLRARNGKELITHRVDRVRVQSSPLTDCEQAPCLGKSSPPEEMCFSNRRTSKPVENRWKMVILLHFRYTFYIPQKTEGFRRRAVRQRGYGLRLLIFKMANDKVDLGDLGQIRYMYTYMQLICVGITRYPRAVWDMETSIYPDKKPRNRSR